MENSCDVIGEFLEWLFAEKHYLFAKYDENDRLILVRNDIEQILFEYFNRFWKNYNKNRPRNFDLEVCERHKKELFALHNLPKKVKKDCRISGCGGMAIYYGINK